MCALANIRKVTGRRKLEGRKGRRTKPFKNGRITLKEVRRAVNADKRIKV